MKLATARGYQSDGWLSGHALNATPDGFQPCGSEGQLPG